jgi:hypothetical protein
MAGNTVTGKEYYDLDGQLLEIKRQLRQNSGYPFDAYRLGKALQDIIEGRFKLRESERFWRYAPWLTISIGGVTAEQLIDDVLSVTWGSVHNWARDIMRSPKNFKVTLVSRKKHLVVLTPEEFGVRGWCPIQELLSADRLQQWSRQHLEGYELEVLPDEAAFHFFLQYGDRVEPQENFLILTSSMPCPFFQVVRRFVDAQPQLYAEYSGLTQVSLDTLLVYGLREI